MYCNCIPILQEIGHTCNLFPNDFYWNSVCSRFPVQTCLNLVSIANPYATATCPRSEWSFWRHSDCLNHTFCVLVVVGLSFLLAIALCWLVGWFSARAEAKVRTAHGARRFCVVRALRLAHFYCFRLAGGLARSHAIAIANAVVKRVVCKSVRDGFLW